MAPRTDLPPDDPRCSGEPSQRVGVHDQVEKHLAPHERQPQASDPKDLVRGNGGEEHQRDGPEQEHNRLGGCNAWMRRYASAIEAGAATVMAAFTILLFFTSLAQWRVGKVAADAARSAADTAARQMQLAERPWVLAAHEIETPLTFLPNGGAFLVLTETQQNSGRSTAINVGSWTDMVPLGPDGGWEPALSHQRAYCDKKRRQEDGATDITGYVLIPDQKRTATVAIGLLPEDVRKAVAKSTDPLRRIGFVIVGCLWYRTLFEPEVAPAHQTRYAYLLGKALGPPEGNFAALQSGVPTGTQPMVETSGTPEGLRLVSQPMGNFAD